jgi:hypothetical protein
MGNCIASIIGLDLNKTNLIVTESDRYIFIPISAQNSRIFSSLKHVIAPRTTVVNIKNVYILPTECICVFYMDLGTNSDHFSCIALND